MSQSPHQSQSSDHPTAPAERGQCKAIDLTAKIALIDGHWQPRVVAEMNDYQFKVVKVEGELHIDFRAGPSGGGSIVLRAGQMAVVPKGVEHKPRANAEVKMLLIEPRGVVNTGDGATDERTVENDQWI